MGCRCIIGMDAHSNTVYELEEDRNRALKELEALKIEVVDTLPFLKH